MREWIDQLVKDRYKNAKELATKVGMTESGFSRGVKAGTFEVENCLRLAQETGMPASDIFAMAGKSDIHELIAALYGKPHGPRDAEATKVATLFSQVRDREAREGFAMMLRGYVKAQKVSDGLVSESPSISKGRQR